MIIGVFSLKSFHRWQQKIAGKKSKVVLEQYIGEMDSERYIAFSTVLEINLLFSFMQILSTASGKVKS